MDILLIQSNHKIAQALRQELEAESFSVTVVYTEGEGLREATQGKYDLIILDYALQEGSAVDVCRKLRNDNIHVPLLLLTPKADVQARVEGLQAGADDCVAAPFALEAILARIRALLRRPHDSEKLTYKNIILDPVAFEVTRAGREIQLSRREFSLLAYLLRNAGSLLTKERIIQHVWNLDAHVLPNTVEVYIGYLRNKLEKPFPGRPLIHTVRGYGYRLGDRPARTARNAGRSAKASVAS